MEIFQNEEDFSTSVLKSFEEIDYNYVNYPGLVVTGSHAPNQIGDKLLKITEARENKIPFLGICFGFQLMLVEFARNVLYLKQANTTEVDPETPHPVVIKMKKLRVGLIEGESYWHKYMFNKKYSPDFEARDMKIGFKKGIADTARIMKHPYFVGVQYHAEYQSSKDKPHPMLKLFLEICKSNAE